MELADTFLKHFSNIKETYPVKTLCKVMQVSKSAYYDWYQIDYQPKKEDKMLEVKVKQLFDKSRNTYGSRRLKKALNAENYLIGRFKVRSLMKRLGFTVRYPKRFKTTTDSNH